MNRLSTSSGISIYNLSHGKTLPQWVADKKRTALRYDDDYRRRLELLQDFDFPQSCTNVKVTPDQQFIVATGMYAPQAKVFELHQLSMKCVRGQDSESVAMEVLSDDFSKLAFLTADRAIELHAKFGFHYRTRVPKAGRSMTYDRKACELLVVGSSDEMWRLNLELVCCPPHQFLPLHHVMVLDSHTPWALLLPPPICPPLPPPFLPRRGLRCLRLLGLSRSSLASLTLLCLCLFLIVGALHTHSTIVTTTAGHVSTIHPD